MTVLLRLSFIGLLGVAMVAGCNPSSPDRRDEQAPTKDATEVAPPPMVEAPVVPVVVPDDLAFGRNHPAFFAGIPGRGRLSATLVTSMGEIHCDLFERETPNAVANFVGLARGEKAFLDPETHAPVRRPFFDGLTFHRVIPGFMIQTGDPTATGTYNPGYGFGDEVVASVKFDRPGRLAMANTGTPESNGSQLFITVDPTPHLDGRHTIFGQCGDLDIVKRISRVPTGPGEKPLEPIRLTGVSFRRSDAPR